MSPRYRKCDKKIKLYNANMDAFVERLRRVRAINGNPALFGMDSGEVKKFSFHRIDVLTKT